MKTQDKKPGLKLLYDAFNLEKGLWLPVPVPGFLFDVT